MATGRLSERGKEAYLQLSDVPIFDLRIRGVVRP